MWLPSGRPELRVLSVSGVVRQHHAPDPSGQAADNTRESRGRRGQRRGERRRGRLKGAANKAKATSGETGRNAIAENATGAWLTVLSSTVNGIELGAQEWRDALFLRYGLDPPDLPTHCNGCEERFTISHALDCNKGGLVTAPHNELRDGVVDLASKAFTPAHVREDPLIYSGRAMSRMKPKPAVSKLTKPTDETTAAPEVTEHKGDLLIRDLWQQGTDSVHDMRVVNTDALSYVRKTPEKCLHEDERGKKNIYLDA